MNLYELGKYKQTILSKLYQSKDIIDAILPPGYSIEDVGGLLPNHIFPFLFIKDTQTEEKTYICIETCVPRTVDFAYKNVKVIIQVITHKNLINFNKKGYLGDRVDIVTDIIDRMLNNSKSFGINRLRLDTVDIYNTEQFYGKVLVYSCLDFNTDKKIR